MKFTQEQLEIMDRKEIDLLDKVVGTKRIKNTSKLELYLWENTDYQIYNIHPTNLQYFENRISEIGGKVLMRFGSYNNKTNQLRFRMEKI